MLKHGAVAALLLALLGVAACAKWKRSACCPRRPVPPVAEPAPPDRLGASKGRKKGPAVSAEVQRWIDRLSDKDMDVLFTATIELARLGALEAVPHLVRVLENHKDHDARLGAATALGDLQSADAVVSLIEALRDRNDLVRVAAWEALLGIAGQDLNSVDGLTEREHWRLVGSGAEEERKEFQRKLRAWWRDNENAVRQKLATLR